MKVLLVLALLASVASNVYLWQQLSQQRAEADVIRASATDVEALRAENETLKKQSAVKPSASEADTRELARLRNEVGQLRKQLEKANALQAQSSSETEHLRAQAAETKLRATIKGTSDYTEEEKELAAVANLSAEQLRALKDLAQSKTCASNLKQIGLAVRLYENEHKNGFPPDFVGMRNELVTPKVLFCPSTPGGGQVSDWGQLNPATIIYQYLNPNGNSADPSKPLTYCPVHGWMGMSDGSVQRIPNPSK